MGEQINIFGTQITDDNIFINTLSIEKVLFESLYHHNKHRGVYILTSKKENDFSLREILVDILCENELIVYTHNEKLDLTEFELQEFIEILINPFRGDNDWNGIINYRVETSIMKRGLHVIPAKLFYDFLEYRKNHEVNIHEYLTIINQKDSQKKLIFEDDEPIDTSKFIEISKTEIQPNKPIILNNHKYNFPNNFDEWMEQNKSTNVTTRI